MTFVLLALGITAGVLTTLAGQGGGLFLLLASSVIVGPHAALAITSPALLLGNLHRAILYRRWIDRRIALPMTLGAVPGAVFGGLLAGAMPPWLLNVLLIGLTILAIAKALRLVRFRLPHAALGPAGFGVGMMTGTAGGAGVLFAPILLSTGLTGRGFVGTAAAIALATHIGRTASYAGLGLFAKDLLLPTLLVSLAIFGGNAVGESLRKRLSDRATMKLEYGMLAICGVIGSYETVLSLVRFASPK
jgi:uncharacterized protein